MSINWLIIFSLVVVLVSSESDTSLEIKTTTSNGSSIIFNDTSARQTNQANGLYSSAFNFPSDDDEVQRQPMNRQPLYDQKKKRRRRRKPKKQNLYQKINPYGQYYPQGPYYNPSQSFQGDLNQNQIYNSHKKPVFGQPGHNGQFQYKNRPGFGVFQGSNQYNAQYMTGFSQFPTPYPGPVKQDTLSSISDALGSIAKNDDFQCVPRMLCEMASSRSPGASQGSLLSNLLNLEPLFTLLTAYNGAGFSPIFSFGRAALLGMTSQGNSASCRYAYPRCPQDPNKLLDYLNNHNGGFFRFFNGGQTQLTNQQPGLSQFYDNLAGIQNNIKQNFGVHQGSNLAPYVYPSEQYIGGYGSHSNSITFAQRNKDYDSVTQEQDMLGSPEKIHSRIQNKPNFEIGNVLNGDQNYITSADSSQWLFPDNSKGTSIKNGETDIHKKEKKLKFPSDLIGNSFNSHSGTRPSYTIGNSYFREPKTLSFPNENTKYKIGVDYQRPLPAYDYSQDIFPIRTGTGNFKLDFNENNNPVTISPLSYTRPYRYKVPYSNQGIRTENNYGNDLVYIVRGNGDPNNPEIVRVNPGQKIY